MSLLVRCYQLDQQAQMPMTHRDYYLKGRNDRILQTYRSFALKVAKSYGTDDAQAEQDVDDLIDFEIDLANVSPPTF